FNQDMPSFIGLSIVAYAFFSIPLIYLLKKRREDKEMLWFLLAPVIIAAVLAGVYFLVNALFLSMR
ncbi:hypothetical protein ACFL6I_21980, partial [candidate division KSB1 bacterium]